MDFPFPIEDRQTEYFVKFDERIRKQLLTIITDDLIEEHRRKPLGQHSDALDRLLNYFRRGGLANKIGIVKEQGTEDRYHIIRFAGGRGQPSRIIDGPSITTLQQAYHAAFLQRIADLRDSLSGDNK